MCIKAAVYSISADAVTLICYFLHFLVTMESVMRVCRLLYILSMSITLAAALGKNIYMDVLYVILLSLCC